MFINKLLKRKLNKTNKNLQFKLRSIFMENKANRQSWPGKGSRKITTQYGQLIFREIFTDDNTEPNWNQHQCDVMQCYNSIVFSAELSRFYLFDTSRINF